MKFTRDQLVFVLEQQAYAVLETIAGTLPQSTSVKDWSENEECYRQIIRGAVCAFDHFVSILWAQTEGLDSGEGLAPTDWAGWGDSQEFWDSVVESNLKASTPLSLPSPKALIESIVSRNWSPEWF